MTTLYGIKQCDTVKKACTWLKDHDIDFRFHDFRTDGLTEQQLRNWVQELGWQTLLNKRSTTWKQLTDETRDAMDESTAIATMLAHPTLIKRPLLDTGNERLVGFTPTSYEQLFIRHTL